jgi:transcriptional regulator GlxA family with amidase domain
MPSFTIFTFPSTHQVLMAEKLLLAESISHEIIPTPKNISSDCGMSIRVRTDGNNIDLIVSVLSGHNIGFSMKEIKK